jgi:hypothetical protein
VPAASVRSVDDAPVTRARWAVLAAFTLLVAATQLLWLGFAPVTSEVARTLRVSAGAVGNLAGLVLGAVVSTVGALATLLALRAPAAPIALMTVTGIAVPGLVLAAFLPRSSATGVTEPPSPDHERRRRHA